MFWPGKLDQHTNQEPHGELPPEIADWLGIWNRAHGRQRDGLFQYTGAAGLHGIVRSGSSWATAQTSSRPPPPRCSPSRGWPRILKSWSALR